MCAPVAGHIVARHRHAGPPRPRRLGRLLPGRRGRPDAARRSPASPTSPSCTAPAPTRRRRGGGIGDLPRGRRRPRATLTLIGRIRDGSQPRVAQPAGDPVDRQQAGPRQLPPSRSPRARRGAAARPARTTAGRRTGCGGRSTPAAPARRRAAARRRAIAQQLAAACSSNSASIAAPDALAHRRVVPQLRVAARRSPGRPSRTPSRRWPAAPAKNGHSSRISRSSSSAVRSRARLSAVPSPNQAGSTIRACVQREHPRDRAEVLDRRRLLAARRPRAEPQPRDLVAPA